MAKRTVTGTIKQPNGAPWRNGLVVFALTKLTYTGGQNVPRTAQGTFSAETDANGQFKISLEAGDTANVRCQYRVTRPNGSFADFLLTTGLPVDLDILLAQQAITDPSALAQHAIVPASATRPGHVKVGAGLAVAEDGTISLPGETLTEETADNRYQSQEDAAEHAARLATTAEPGHIIPGEDFLVDSDGKLRHSQQFLNDNSVAAHLAAPDPHQQYLTQGRGDARYVRASRAGLPLSALDLGAKGDGSNDFAALQAALGEAGDAVLRELLLPYTANGYGLDEPLYHATEGLVFGGNYDAPYRLAKLFGDFHGPLIFCGKPASNMSFTPSLLTGEGRSINITEELEWINFSDLAVNLNGWTGLTVEFTVRAGSYSTPADQYANLFSSIGARSDNYFGNYTTRAFQLSVDGEGKMVAYITVNGTQRVLGPTPAGTFPLNANVHVALSWDGNIARLYVNRILKASVAASGPLTQSASEDLILGRFPLAWPDFASAQKALPGQYCNLRISNIARYTADGAPPGVEFTPDANALLLATFDHLERYPLLRVYCGASKFGWTMARSAVDGGYTHNVGLRNLHLVNASGPALLTQNCPTASARRISATGKGTAVCFAGYKFLSEYRDLRATSGAGADYKVGLCWSGPAGAGARLVGADVQGWVYGLAGSDGVSGLDRVFANSGPQTKALIYWHQGKPVFNDVWLDIENDPGAGVAREAFAIFSGMQSATFNGGSFNIGSNVADVNHPHLLLDFAQEYAALNLVGTRHTRVGGDAVIGLSQGVRNGGRVNINVLGAQKLDSFFAPSTKPWVVQSDADFALLRENGLAPQLTSAQIFSLPGAVLKPGLVIYNVDDNKRIYWDGLGWNQ